MFANPYLLSMLGACVVVIVALVIGTLVYGRPGVDPVRGALRMRQLKIAAQVIAFALIVVFILLRDKF